MFQRLTFVLLIALAFAAVQGTARPVAAQIIPTVEYRIQEGDTLAKIARRFCTTWQEVFEFNKGYIGDSPNDLRPGTLIYVIDRCGSRPPTTSPDGVYDRGPRLYANGTVLGNVYTVARGDTLYSIGQRFGVSVEDLQETNGLTGSKVKGGQRLIIPGLAQQPPRAKQPNITITSPLPGSYLDGPYVASGTGQGLPEGNVVVRLLDGNGDVMAQQATVLQGENVGIGGPGVWSVRFDNVYGQPQSNGAIEAFNPETGVSAAVSIWFTGR
jgi:LysM repeat protein